MRSLVPRGFFDSLLDTGFARDIAWPGFFTSVFDRQHPFVDIEETDNMYVVKADVPGFDKENIDIELSDNVLTISGKVDERSETTDTDGGYVRRERRYGAFRRSFMLPDEVDHDKAKASFKNGVLKIEIPKTGRRPHRKISIS
ncbi:MAG: Hsp20/alpha crystallin family protein [Bacillota bacterium]|jgi:HSP20 family protein|nr:Hsp20/alpha crystallin family protein [Bacillota bacterium]HOB90394.1 Hsp20/alpha crystallin family protein [Bacillota bacterium]HPZ53866.1 Hsp20/alpha crystallin family protein [Bacillota bacterium]HQD17375.1 Hsp20/alpha crystallin family protein [Bacillota bacterium]